MLHRNKKKKKKKNFVEKINHEYFGGSDVRNISQEKFVK